MRDNIICRFRFDRRGNKSSYIPKTDKLNRIISRWARAGINFAGIVHSHPNGNDELSDADILYATDILKNNQKSGCDSLFFPIVLQDTGWRFEIRSYKIIYGSDVQVSKEDTIITDFSSKKYFKKKGKC